jgi:formate dehydrogenase iron-sulfur subunit
MDKPEAYQLPSAENAVLPSRNNAGGYVTGVVTAVLGVLGGLIALRRRRPPADETPPEPGGSEG